MSQDKIEKIYGKSCDTKNLTMIDSPFELIIAWDKTKKTKRIQCHKLIASKLKAALTEILNEYGIDKIKELEINVFGGVYNCRLMRGGTKPSMHSWGLALDLNPDKNQLKWGKDKAQFAKPEYKKMIDIFYKHGFISLGREKNYDWMHFEIKV